MPETTVVVRHPSPSSYTGRSPIQVANRPNSTPMSIPCPPTTLHDPSIRCVPLPVPAPFFTYPASSVLRTVRLSKKHEEYTHCYPILRTWCTHIPISNHLSHAARRTTTTAGC